MIERSENITIDDYYNAILEHYNSKCKDKSEIKEYEICISLGVGINAATNRVFVKNNSIIDKKYYYLDLLGNSNYDFFSTEEIFMDFFNKNDDVYWHLID